jgi:hypothetical protein
MLAGGMEKALDVITATIDHDRRDPLALSGACRNADSTWISSLMGRSLTRLGEAEPAGWRIVVTDGPLQIIALGRTPMAEVGYRCCLEGGGHHRISTQIGYKYGSA